MLDQSAVPEPAAACQKLMSIHIRTTHDGHLRELAFAMIDIRLGALSGKWDNTTAAYIAKQAARVRNQSRRPY